MITEEQAIAAMRVLEEQTIARCAAVASTYANSKNDTKGKPSSRIAAAKRDGALDVADKIRSMPRKGA